MQLHILCSSKYQSFHIKLFPFKSFPTSGILSVKSEKGHDEIKLYVHVMRELRVTKGIIFILFA